MSTTTLHLRPLRVEDEQTFATAVEEFRLHNPDWSFAFDYPPTDSFTKYVRRLEGWARGEDLPGNFVPNTYLVGVIDGEVVGRVSLRHELNDFLSSSGGHIGYGVVPRFRGRGYATQMLRLTLPMAADLGIERAFITCDNDNLASRRVIEKNNGEFESFGANSHGELLRRYWIETRV